MTEEINENEALEVLGKARAFRTEKCREEIQTILDRYNCVLVGVPQLTPDGRVTATVALRTKGS